MPSSRSWTDVLPLAGGALIALLVWLFPSSGCTDAVIAGACLLALLRWRRAGLVWLSAPGLAALLLAAYPVVALLWAVHPAAAAADLARDLRLPAGAFALSLLITGGRRLDRALLLSAGVLLAVFAADLVRLTHAHLTLGPHFPGARYYKPQVLNHPNVSSLLAAATFFICLYGAWTRKASRWAAAGLVLGALLSLAYLYVMASRGPQAAFAVAAGAAFLLVPRTWKGRAAGLVLLLIAGILVGFNVKTLNERFLDRKDLLSGRGAVWAHTAALARERPWFGYGYGKDTFQAVYYASHPPASPHRFPHPHQYALFVLFQGGRAWLILHAAFWLLLAGRLLKAMARERDEAARLRLVLLALLLVMWQAYGLGDYPDNRLKLAFTALPALALAATTPARDQAESTRTRTSG